MGSRKPIVALFLMSLGIVAVARWAWSSGMINSRTLWQHAIIGIGGVVAAVIWCYLFEQGERYDSPKGFQVLHEDDEK